MRLNTFPPHPALAPYVRFYWILEPEPSGAEPERIIPGTDCDLIVQVGPPARVRMADGDWEIRRPAGFVEGHFPSYFMLEFSGLCRLFGVRFTSTGLYPLIKVPLADLNQRFIDITDMFPRTGSALVERLMESVSARTLGKIMDRFLLGHLDPVPEEGPLKEAVRVLTGENGMVQIGRVSAAVACTERRLERMFRRHIGLSPEQFAQRLRLNYFIRRVRSGSGASYTELAHDCRFADQSHLIRTFKQFTGLTPGEYFHQRLPIQNALNEQQ